MRWILGWVAALVLTSAAAAQDAEPAQEAIPPAKAQPKCFELDEEEQAAYDALVAKPGYFEEFDFECEQDWLDAETTFGPAFKSLGEVPLVEQRAGAKNITITVRRLVWGGYNGRNYKLSRLDCTVNEEDESTGGRFLLREKNPWSRPNNGHWEIKLTAADCAFITEMLDDFDPSDVQPNLPCDPEGSFILHANATITEYNDYAKGSFLRGGYCSLIDDDPKSKAAEEGLDNILYWLEGRTRESGRKVRR